MNKIKLIVSFFLLTPMLFSCEIDEESNLLFKLKDTLQAAGIWQASGGTDKFEFFSDGTFTAKIDGKAGSGTFVYSLNTNESIWSSNNKIATFALTWNRRSTTILFTDYKKLTVKEELNGDRYFQPSTSGSSKKKFIQIS